MELESKYSIGDDVWLIDNNKIETHKVEGVLFSATSMGVVVSYQFGEGTFGYPEEKLFESKEELLKSL